MWAAAGVGGTLTQRASIGYLLRSVEPLENTSVEPLENSFGREEASMREGIAKSASIAAIALVVSAAETPARAQ